jgi:hypothetical protein
MRYKVSDLIKDIKDPEQVNRTHRVAQHEGEQQQPGRTSLGWQKTPPS